MAKPNTRSKFKEAKWKCTAEGLYSDTICGHINRGPDQKCAKCNTHRPADVVFFTDETSEFITDKEKIADAKAGPDWRCLTCNYDNKAEDFHCVHCGTLRNKDEEEWLGLERDRKKKVYTGMTKAEKSGTSGGWKKYLKYAWFGLAAIVILILIFMFTGTTEYEVTVTGFSWEREILIEEERLVEEEGWDYPSNARVLSKETRQSGTKQVYSHSEWTEEPVYEEVLVGQEYVDCGEVDNGNGYIETVQCLEDVYETQQVGTEQVEHEVYIDEPVYDTWYVYEIERWFYSYSEYSDGNDKNPFWPKYTLAKKERVQDEVGTYVVHLKSNDPDSKFQSLTYQTNESEWNAIKLNKVYIADVKRSGTVVRLKTQ